MKKIYQKILNFPQMVNQKILNAPLNNAVDNFDAQDGVRSYTKSIYQLLSLVAFITMELAIISGAVNYFTDPATSGLGKLGTVLTALVLMYSAFPIANIIRSRGESLGNSHNGMVEFIFKDFVTTNIKILGEVAAIGAFVSAVCFGLSFVFDTNLYSAASGTSLLAGLAWLANLPMQALNTLLSTLQLGLISDVIKQITSFNMESAQIFTGDMKWNYHDLFLVAGGFINTLVVLVVLYVNLAIYNMLYNMVATFSKWIQNPCIPISTKNRS